MPITTGSKEDIIKIVQVIAQKVENLIQRTIGHELPITYLTIFSHNKNEYNRFIEWLSELGIKSEANNGVKFELKKPIETVGGEIKNIRVRNPDPYRSQIGCADVKVENYDSFKNEELPKHPDNLRIPEHPKYEMIEFFDLDSNDVLAYVMSQ